VLGLGVCVVSGALIAVGFAITVASALVTWVLHLAGWGKPPGRRPRGQWGMRVRDMSAREGHPGCVGCRLAGRGGPRVKVVEARAEVTAEPESVEPVSVGPESVQPVSVESVG
jgi:hypothetical protein